MLVKYQKLDVNQSTARQPNSVPPAAGRTQPGYPWTRTAISLATSTPYTAEPTTEWMATRSVGRLEAEDEDAVEDDRERAEDGDPAAPAMNDVRRRHPRGGRFPAGAPTCGPRWTSAPGRARSRPCEPGLRGDGGREDRGHQIGVLGSDVEGWHGGEDTSTISRVQEGDPGQPAGDAGDGAQAKKPKFWWLIAGFAVVSGIVLVLALASPFSPSTSDVEVAEGDAAAGATVFEQNCAGCHGPQGTGGGVGPAACRKRARRGDGRERHRLGEGRHAREPRRRDRP